MSEEWIEKAAIECASRVLIGDGEKQFARVIRKHFENGDPPRPWLRAEEVTEEGWYWWRSKTYLEATVVRLRRIRDVLHYERANYYYPIPSCESGTLWQRIPEPELPKEDR